MRPRVVEHVQDRHSLGGHAVAALPELGDVFSAAGHRQPYCNLLQYDAPCPPFLTAPIRRGQYNGPRPRAESWRWPVRWNTNLPSRRNALMDFAVAVIVINLALL